MIKLPPQKPGRSKQDYGTPRDFLAALRAQLGIREWAHDFAADEFNAVAETYFDAEMDAFKQDKWHERCGIGWGWLNPPFSHIAPWAEKCVECGENGGRIAFLVPAAVGANWYRNFVHAKARVLFLNGRLTFGGCTTPYPKDCLVALYGPEVKVGYDVYDWRNRCLI